MRFLKLIFFSAVILFVVLTAMGLLLPANVNISRAIDISKDSTVVFNKLKNIENWNEWMEGLKDSTQKAKFQNNAWSTSSTTIKIISAENNTVKTEWISEGKTHLASFNIFTSNNKTTVQWLFVQHFSWYPWERFSSIFIEKAFGQIMEQSLQNLKNICEASN
jgi:hypothetical protein